MMSFCKEYFLKVAIKPSLCLLLWAVTSTLAQYKNRSVRKWQMLSLPVNNPISLQISVPKLRTDKIFNPIKINTSFTIYTSGSISFCCNLSIYSCLSFSIYLLFISLLLLLLRFNKTYLDEFLLSYISAQITYFCNQI